MQPINCFLFFALLTTFCRLAEGKTFTVTSAADDGAGTLRQAIKDANADTSGSATIINFNFKSKPTVIYIKSALPAITKKMTIDGYANGMGSYNFNPPTTAKNNSVLYVIVEAEDNKKNTFDGFTINASGSGTIIQALVIGRFYRGVLLNGVSSATIRSNFIGTNDTTEKARGNTIGIDIQSSSGVYILDNIISYNRECGINSYGATNCRIYYNTIGLNKAGGMAGNGLHGVNITHSENIIIGYSYTNQGNIISGNAQNGIRIVHSNYCTIHGNYIGTGIGGHIGARNDHNGIRVEGLTGLTVYNNLISGNKQNGISIIEDPGLATDSIFKNNYIGVTVDGINKLPNGENGIYGETVTGITIGGSESNRNIISGNSRCGIKLVGLQKHRKDNLISYNYIGTNKNGTDHVGNQHNGIRIEYSRDAAIDHNLISGNILSGIFIIETGGHETNSTITSNYIGVQANGLIKLGNEEHGIYMENPSAVKIGGSAETRNIISGNHHCGIRILGSPANYKPNIISHNYIGTNKDGNDHVNNHHDGIFIADNHSGPVRAATISNNLISGNQENGIQLKGCRASEPELIIDNIIGLDSTGSKEIKNNQDGIKLCGSKYVIAERNIMSGNGNAGIKLTSYDDKKNPSENKTSTDNYVIDNLIGYGLDGTTKIKNYNFAILFDNSSTSGNNYVPVGAESTANTVAGNIETHS